MPRRLTGSIEERELGDGSTSYVLRVRAYGRAEKETLGNSKEGWNRTRADIEAERIVQQIERGTWVPPRERKVEEKRAATIAQLGARVDETFASFARGTWWAQKHDLDATTESDYLWRLGYLERFFGRYRLSEIDVRLVDRFRTELAAEAQTIREAAERGRPLIVTQTDSQGRKYRRRRRPLSNTSINAMIKLLGQILQLAFDYQLIDRNPVRVGERSARFLPKVKPNRTFLEVDEFTALLEAAGELDRDARADRQGIGRRAMIATLGLAGLRISELLDLRVRDVDLHRCRLQVLDAKTAAGVREVEISMQLRDELEAYVLDRRALAFPVGPGEYFFGSATGGRRDPHRFRDRILYRAVERANAKRIQDGFSGLPKITPHSLRRTWATFCAQIGRDPKWIASQIGHTDPQFTFSVYQQVATRRYVDLAEIWALMRFGDEPEAPATGRQMSRATDANVPVNVPAEDPTDPRATVQPSIEE